MDTVNDDKDEKLGVAPDKLYLTRLRLKALRSETLRTLGDSHQMHQRIYAAFPDKADGGPGRVLWRVEEASGLGDGHQREISALIQSDKEPDSSRWTAGGWVCGADGPRTLPLRDADHRPLFPVGASFRFRLRANPTFRVAAGDKKGKRLSVTCEQRRAVYLEQHGLTAKDGERPLSSARVAEALLAEWLERKGKEGGFQLAAVPTGADWIDPFSDAPASRLEVRITPEGFRRGWQTRTSDEAERMPAPLDHDSVLFEGVLTVTDTEAFINTLASGIGSAKSFGFGLLSLARK